MTNWAPILAGFAIIVAAVAIVRLAPNSTWGQELRRSYGIRPSGERGQRTRRDHVRSAGLAAVTGVGLFVTSVVADSFIDRAPDNPSAGVIALAYSLIASILTLMAAVSAIRSLWKASAWRMELPDTPEHRRGLADAIDHLLDGGISTDERRDYLDVVYLQPQLEQIRRATLRLSRQNATGMPDGY